MSIKKWTYCNGIWNGQDYSVKLLFYLTKLDTGTE